MTKYQNPLTKIILASRSPRRRYLLELINLEFEVAPSHIDETVNENESAEEYVERLAMEKARAAISDYRNALIIGADTSVVLNESILGKPATKDEARSMLTELSYNRHEVIGGVALIATNSSGSINSEHSFTVTTEVTFGSLTEYEIEEYISTDKPYDKAGGYGIQDDWGALFVKRIFGDYYNVVGFPLHEFYQALKSFAPELLPHPNIETKS